MDAVLLVQLWKSPRGNSYQHGTPELVNQTWPTLTGSRNVMSYIAARVHENNEISTATPPGQTTQRLLRILPDVWVCWNVWTNEELKMASVNRKLMYAVFDFSQVHTSSSLRSSLVLLPDPENMDGAVGTSLLSCIEAEIYVMSFLLPVKDHHLRFTTHPNIGPYSHLSLRVARHRKYNRWNFVAILNTSWDISYFIWTSGNGGHFWCITHPMVRECSH